MDFKVDDFCWSQFEDGEWYEAQIKAVEGDGMYSVYYHEYDDTVYGQPEDRLRPWTKEDEEAATETSPIEDLATLTVDSPVQNGKVSRESASRGRSRDSANGSMSRGRSTGSSSLRKTSSTSRMVPARRSSSSRPKSSSGGPPRRSQSVDPARGGSRTNALYEHGKRKGQARLSRDSDDVLETSLQAECSFAPRIKTREDSHGSGAARIERLYNSGKSREAAKREKENLLKAELAAQMLEQSYDARLGFNRSANTGLGKDLVTTGARTSALYKEAQMREQKRKQRRQELEAEEQASSFKPRLATRGSFKRTSSGGDVSDRLYRDGESRQARLERLKREKEETDADATFTPDLSASQSYCEGPSLPGARHEALYLQHELVMSKREEMAEEVDEELTFTPAVNYVYNDELLPDSEEVHSRLYSRTHSSSKLRQAEMEEKRKDDPNSFKPKLVSRQPRSRASSQKSLTKAERQERLYKDGESQMQRRLQKRQELEKELADMQKLKLTKKARAVKRPQRSSVDRLYKDWDKIQKSREERKSLEERSEAALFRRRSSKDLLRRRPSNESVASASSNGSR